MHGELERRREVLAVTGLAVDAWVEWQSGDPAALIVPERLRQAWVDMATVWADGLIPGDCRELARLVEQFDAKHLTPWLDEMERSGKQALLPGNGFWGTLEAIASLLAAVTAPAVKPLEPIADLAAQGVGHAQIARIYGFRDARGNWSEQMVREELAKPGCHTGDGWVDPRQRRKTDRVAARQAAVERARQAAAKKIERLESAKPSETLAELVDQGVSATQIARIFRCSVEDVLAQCRAEQIPEPQQMVPSTSMAGLYAPDEEIERGEAFTRQAEYRRQDAVETSGAGSVAEDGQAMTVEQQIVACHLQGLSVEETVQALQHVEGVGARKVKAVVKRYQESPEAFGLAERIPAVK